MSRTVVRLTSDHLDALAAPCRSCLFWELDPVRRGRRRPDPAAEKEALGLGGAARVGLVRPGGAGRRRAGRLRRSTRRRRSCPGAAGFPTAPVSPDAVLLTTAYVDPAARGGGLGRMLVRAMARDLVERDDPGGRGVRRHPRPRRRRLPCCRRTSSAASGSRPSGRTPPPRGCGWTCARRSPGRTRWRRRWSGWWASYARHAEAAARPGGARTAVEARTTRSGSAGDGRSAAEPRQAMKSASSLSSAAFGRAPTIDFTTSPPW